MRISTVIPSYNAAPFLEETLATAFAQTLPPHEVIVVDDGSADDSVEIARRAGARVIACDRNRGVSAVRNEGIRAATGEAVALLDADDLWLPHHLATLAELLLAFPEAGLAYARAEKFGDERGPTRRTVPPGHATDGFAMAARVNLAQPSAALVRRDAALAVGGFDEDWRYGEDFDFWLRLARDYPVVCTDAITSRYRIHAAGKGRRKADDREGQFRSRARVLDQLDPGADAERSTVLRQILVEVWEDHVRSAWQDGDARMFRRMVRLARYVPDSDPAARRWSALRHWFWARRLWNRLPDGVRDRAKSTVRRIRGGGRPDPGS